MNYNELVSNQKAFFESGATLSLNFRVRVLKQLKNGIMKMEDEIANVMKEDLGKSNFECFMSEIGLTLSEASYMIKHLKAFSKDKRVHTPLTNFASKSYVKKVPYGSVLIMSPWNYPFLLTMEPLIDALSAGNTCIIKPSNYSPNTSMVIKKLIKSIFPPEHVEVITGGRNENSELLNQKFDYIFFTGSKEVGKIVMKKASENLTPVTLELGEKSPCIVDETANIPLTARRIVFGKFLNCGQTCVAPDYILCHKEIKEKLIECIKNETIKQYGENPLLDPDYGKIINEKHFGRILGLIDKNKVAFGGKNNPDALKIEPTVIDNVSFGDPIMQEEIFGPVLPVLTYNNLKEAVASINKMPHPLALYIFSRSKENISYVTSRCRFGGGCINDTIIHLATSYMGFGGTGESGMGSYHGKNGFDTFSHSTSIVDKKNWIDLSMRYRPFTEINKKIVKMLLK